MKRILEESRAKVDTQNSRGEQTGNFQFHTHFIPELPVGSAEASQTVLKFSFSLRLFPSPSRSGDHKNSTK